MTDTIDQPPSENTTIYTESAVRAWNDRIREMCHDDEMAHSEEDRMRESVLRAIADGRAIEPAKCAAAALESDQIDFARWCA